MVDSDKTRFLEACAHAQKLRTQALFSVHFANRSFVERGWSDPVYVAARSALDEALLKLAQAKWNFGSVDGTYQKFVRSSPSDRKRLEFAEAAFKSVINDCEQIKASCELGSNVFVNSRSSTQRKGEIEFIGDTPLVPTIGPIVVLQGGNYEMGRQYAQQVIEIYGAWIFQQLAAREISEKEESEIKAWGEQLAKHMPEVVQFSEGWADGAAQNGINLSRLHALAVWTGFRPPAKEPRPMAFAQTDGDNERITAAYLGVAAGAQAAEDSDMCSGIFAWGNGTGDGSLVAGSTTDHDCTFQATIVAFPEEGYPFIYTPFSANGSIPIIGDFHMAGHPGMNAAGVAYIHHGGANTGEPKEEWGYGIRRGAATFHLLQFSDSSQTSRELMKPYPVGDAGISLGTVGGMFGDASSGYSLEARPGAPNSTREIIRTHSMDVYGKSFDFLYANNNAMAPESGHLNVPPPGGYQYSIAGGWHTLDWAQINADAGPKVFRRHNTRSSEGRNRYAYRMMMQGYGHIDVEYMKMVYRQSGEMPEGNLEHLQALWEAGVPWNSSTAHRGNAFTAVMNPQRGDNGRYLGCIGPASRAVHARGPEHGYYYHDETNAFWELTLRNSPEGVLQAAIEQAQTDIDIASKAYNGSNKDAAYFPQLSDWLSDAKQQYRSAVDSRSANLQESHSEKLARISRSLRSATRAQVRARQVAEALMPPPTSPSMLSC